MLYAPGHPLVVGKTKYLAEHRAIVWDRLGPGGHPCHHCGITIYWRPGQGSRGDALVVDHLDREVTNNAPENLAPSCVTCNILNSDRAVEDHEKFRVRANGTRLRGEHRACEVCGKEFVHWPSGRKKNGGRFCSRACLYKGRSTTIQPGELTVAYGSGRTRAVELKCEQCGETFLKAASLVKAGKGRYCSPACNGLSRRGKPRGSGPASS